MLKKMIVGLLVVTVAVAAGFSIYNASAISPVDSRVESLAVRSIVQAGAKEPENGAVDDSQDKGLTVDPMTDHSTTAHAQGFGGGSGLKNGNSQGGGRRAGQDLQTGVDGSASVGDAQSNSAFGRPSWAGGNGRGRNAGGSGAGYGQSGIGDESP